MGAPNKELELTKAGRIEAWQLDSSMGPTAAEAGATADSPGLL
jgi:hypothetical protein